jgi:hypothetical protein
VQGIGSGLIYCAGIRLQGLRKTIKAQDSRSPGRDLNPGRPKSDVNHSTLDVRFHGLESYITSYVPLDKQI